MFLCFCNELVKIFDDIYFGDDCAYKRELRERGRGTGNWSKRPTTGEIETVKCYRKWNDGGSCTIVAGSWIHVVDSAISRRNIPSLQNDPKENPLTTKTSLLLLACVGKGTTNPEFTLFILESAYGKCHQPPQQKVNFTRLKIFLATLQNSSLRVLRDVWAAWAIYLQHDL